MSERLPPPSSARVKAAVPAPADLVRLEAGTRLFRMHPLGGPRPVWWNEWRHWGPTTSRFDQHTPPPREQARGIAYLTCGPTAFPAVVAEYFQDDSGAGVGPVDLRLGRPTVTVFELATDLLLLDLDGGWPTRAGGNQAIGTGPRGRSRHWARVIYTHHRRIISGLAYPSSVWGPGRCVALWETAVASLPDRPLVTRSLDDPALAPALGAAAVTLNTFVV